MSERELAYAFAVVIYVSVMTTVWLALEHHLSCRSSALVAAFKAGKRNILQEAQLAYILAAERGQDDFTLDRWLDHVWKGRRNGRQRGKSM